MSPFDLLVLKFVKDLIGVFLARSRESSPAAGTHAGTFMASRAEKPSGEGDLGYQDAYVTFWALAYSVSSVPPYLLSLSPSLHCNSPSTLVLPVAGHFT